MGTLAKIRTLHLRDGLPIKEIERRTGLARNTIKAWLRKGEMVESKYPQRQSTELKATLNKAAQSADTMRFGTPVLASCSRLTC